MCGSLPSLAHRATVLGDTLRILAAWPVLMNTSSAKLLCVELSTQSSPTLLIVLTALYVVATLRNRDLLEMRRGSQRVSSSRELILSLRLSGHGWHPLRRAT